MAESGGLLQQQSPGLKEGFTVGQEAQYIASEWGIYSDMKGRASYLLKALAEEIRRLESQPCSGACLLKLQAETLDVETES